MDNPIVNYDKQKESLTKEFNIFCKLCKCATYTNIYVDNKAEELFMSLFGENKLFIFTDFHEILQNHNHNTLLKFSFINNQVSLTIIHVAT